MARRQLERRGFADHHLLTILLLHPLVDRQHAHVGENGFAGVHFGAGLLLGLAVALGEDHVDAIVGQDEARGGAFRRYADRDRAHARGQNRGHVAGALGHHQLGVADRLAGDERRARDRTGQSLDGARMILAANEVAGIGVGRPFLPDHVARRQLVTDVDIGFRHQHVDGGDLGRRRDGRLLGLFRSPRQHGGHATGGESDGQHDNTRGFHTLDSLLDSLLAATAAAEIR